MPYSSLVSSVKTNNPHDPWHQPQCSPEIWLIAAAVLFWVFSSLLEISSLDAQGEKYDGVEHEFRVGDIHIVVVVRLQENFLWCSRAGGDKKTAESCKIDLLCEIQVRFSFYIKGVNVCRL